jgi:hypothetical protein
MVRVLAAWTNPDPRIANKLKTWPWRPRTRRGKDDSESRVSSCVWVKGPKWHNLQDSGGLGRIQRRMGRRQRPWV